MTNIPLIPLDPQFNYARRKSLSIPEKPLPELSNKILSNIFQYFSCTELLRLSTVCSRWSNIIQDIPKFARFTADDTLPAIVSILHEFPQSLLQLELKSLDGNISTVLRKVRLLQTNLQHLRIDSCAVVKECNRTSGRRIRTLLDACSELQSVSLTNLSFEMTPTLKVFSEMQHLRSLTIGNNPCLTSSDLLTLILNCDLLETLHLYRIGCLCDQDMRFAFGVGGRLSGQLKKLTLDRVEELGSSGYECILNCKKLHSLRINYSTGLAPETVFRLGEELRHLRRLHLDRVCRIRSDDLVKLFSATGKKKLKLSEFGLIDCCTRMTDDALLALAASQSQSLVRLQLRDCVGLRDVSCLFNQFRHLREIDLSGCAALQQPPFFPQKTKNHTKSDTNRNNDASVLSSISSMSKIVLPRHLRKSFDSTLQSHLQSRIKYDKQVNNEEEEVNDLTYLTPVCIKF